MTGFGGLKEAGTAVVSRGEGRVRAPCSGYDFAAFSGTDAVLAVGQPFVTICHRASMADPEARRGPRLHGPPVVVHLHRPNASAHYRGPTPDGGVPSWCVLVHRLRHKHRRPQPPGEPSWTRSCVRRGSTSFCGRRKPNWMG